jgi:hypothetical protein
VIWQKAAGASDHLERGRVLCVVHSNEKVADRPREERFRDTPKKQHTRVARDRVRLLQERPRELADGGVRLAEEKKPQAAEKQRHQRKGKSEKCFVGIDGASFGEFLQPANEWRPKRQRQ